MRNKGEPTVWTTDPTLDIVAAVFRQALADAQHGDASAVEWLDLTAPDWRQLNRRKPRKPYRSRSLYDLQKGDHAHGIKNAQNKSFSTLKSG